MIIEDVHLGPTEVGDVKCLICDIDGTVADVAHRRKYVATRPKNWKAFERGLLADPPIQWVIDIVNKLHMKGAKIIFCSGRGDHQREATEAQLMGFGLYYDRLYMRKSGDHRDDGIVKKELLDQIIKDGYKPDLVLDDRDRVVKMWRENSLLCVQVAEGDF